MLGQDTVKEIYFNKLKKNMELFRITKISVMYVLIIFLVLVILVHGQEPTMNVAADKKRPFDLVVSTDKNICIGDRFAITSRLTNISDENVVIDLRKIKRIRNEVAYGQESSEQIHIPKGRGGFWNTFESKNPPESFRLLLKPKEFYELKYIIDPNEDIFYKTEGDYLIQIIDLPDSEKSGDTAHFDEIKSNELIFEIKGRGVCRK